MLGALALVSTNSGDEEPQPATPRPGHPAVAGWVVAATGLVSWYNAHPDAPPVDLSAFITNLTNEEVRLNVANGFPSTGVEAAIYAPPRMFGVRMRYRFGS